jgi:hypothetical protein
MLRSIIFIKTVHTATFVFMSATQAMIFYEIMIDRTTLPTWIAIALFLVDGVVLLANGWKYPPTTYAGKLGSTHGQITDKFLPKWFADQRSPNPWQLVTTDCCFSFSCSSIEEVRSC